MKKIILILTLLLLTGCANTVSINFNNDINMNVKLSFTLEEYRYYLNRNSNETLSKEEASSAITALRTDELDAFIEGNSDTFKEKRYSLVDENYNLEYEYTYNYSNFDNNSILNKCFENFNYVEDNDNIYINISGKSICSPFKLSIKADNKMIANNADKKVNNEYLWNVLENNNNIYMTISKNNIKSSNTLYIILFMFAIILSFVLVVIRNKYNKNNY